MSHVTLTTPLSALSVMVCHGQNFPHLEAAPIPIRPSGPNLACGSGPRDVVFFFHGKNFAGVDAYFDGWITTYDTNLTDIGIWGTPLRNPLYRSRPQELPHGLRLHVWRAIHYWAHDCRASDIGRTTRRRRLFSKHVAHPTSHAGRKFGRRSTTATDMSYDLTKFDVIARILAVYCNLANFTCIC